MMSTRSRKDGTETPPSLNTDEIAAMQKQIHEKEHRLSDEERALEQRCRKEESQDSVIEAPRLAALNIAPRPRTTHHPITKSTRVVIHDPEYRDYENISNFALREAIASIPMFDKQTSVLQFACACRQARSMIPRQIKVSLTKLVKGKIRGVPMLPSRTPIANQSACGWTYMKLMAT